MVFITKFYTMKTIFIFLFFLFQLPQKNANFIIIDQLTKEELIGARVMVDTTEYFSDLFGVVSINNNEKKKYNVNISYPSYKTKKLDSIELNSMIIELEQIN